MTMFKHHSMPLEPFVNPRPVPTIPTTNRQPQEPATETGGANHDPSGMTSEIPYLASEKLWQATRLERAYQPTKDRNSEMGRGAARERSRSRPAATARSDLLEAKAHFHQAGRDFKIALSLAVSVVKNFPDLLNEKRERRRFKACEAIQRREMAQANGAI